MRMNFPTRAAFLLKKEIKPNGNQLHFSYKTIHGIPRLTHVKTVNRTETSTLNELNLHYSSKKCPNGLSMFCSLDTCTISTPAGDQVIYHQKNDLRLLSTGLGIRSVLGRFLEKVDSLQSGESEYEMTNFIWKINKITKPRSRFFKVDYCSNGKVRALYEPQEDLKIAVKLYQFEYEKNLTKVFDALNQLTIYRFDDAQRLSEINYLNEKQKIIRQDVFQWSPLEGQEGWLKSKSIQLVNDLYHLKTYRYDTKGNITRETLYGNLTGDKPETFTAGQKRAMDSYSLTYEYIDDERNLLKEKSIPEGLSISYDYLPNTNLCTKILYSYDGKIQERFFNSYDENGQVQTHIQDDGSGLEQTDESDVKVRKIKIIEAVKIEGHPSFGKPEKITEYYLDPISKEKVLLKETAFTYDAKGCETERKISNSHGYCYATSKKYDEKLRLKEETDPFGYSTRYDYDESDNKTEEEYHLDQKEKSCYEYDFANRLTKKREKHNNNEEFITTYAYDSLNQLISKKVAMGRSQLINMIGWAIKSNARNQPSQIQMEL